MTAARICIVSPLHPSLNPRVVKEADALAGAGHDVMLVASDFSAWAREADRKFKDRPWRVVAAPKFGPLAPPAIRARELVRRAVAGVAVPRLGSRSDRMLAAVLHPSAPDLVRAACRVPADLYIGHYTPGLLAAALAARANGARHAFDAEDFHPGDLPDTPENTAARDLIGLVEKRHLPGAAYVSAAAPLIAKAYAETYPIAHPVTVLNVFPLAEAPDAPCDRPKQLGQRSIYWFSQTIGRDRGLECLLAAVSRSRARPSIVLRGARQRGIEPLLRQLASDLGIEDRLTLLEPGPPDEMVKLAAAHDAGFVGETGATRNHRIMLSNKQFIYLLAGMPIIMSDIPSHRAFADEEPGAVLLYRSEDPDSLASAIDNLFSEPGRLQQAAATAWKLGRERFNWDRERSVLLDAVAGALDCAGA